MSTACSVNVDMIGTFKSSFDMLKYLPVLSCRAGVALTSLVSPKKCEISRKSLRNATENFRETFRSLETLLSWRSFLAVYWIQTNQQTDRQAKYIHKHENGH